MQSGRILLIDDHTLFRTGMKLILSQLRGAREILEAESIDDALARHSGTRIDLILLDIQLPGINGLDGVALLHEHLPGARILLVSGSVEALSETERERLGVLGWLPKSADPREVEQAVLRYTDVPDDVQSQSAPLAELTARQMQVLELLCRGKSNKVIAYELGLAENTVRVHVSAVLEQLRVKSRTEAVIEAQRRGLAVL
ncbi:MAG TPA: response regulator transcription factor [Pseudomonas sp.]